MDYYLVFLNMRTILLVVIFPVLNQMILGGHPFMFAISEKSASKVTIIKSLILAKSQISISGASSNLNSLMCFELGKMELIF